MKLRSVGILGGMGPQATIALQQLLIDRVDAADDRDHIPLLIDMNPQVPSRIDYLIHSQGVNPAPVIVMMAQRLEKAGASALAMPCNTAHLFSQDIENSVAIPFLNMIELTRKRLVEDGVTRVGILASPAVQASRLFDEAFKDNGVDSLWPDDMDELLHIIQIIKGEGVSEPLFERFYQSVESIKKKGADALLIGCSEFSLFNSFWQEKVYDSLSLLADEIITFSRKS